MAEGLLNAIAKLSLFAVLGIAVVGAVIFIAIYGIMRDPDAEYTTAATGVLFTGAPLLIGAVVALLKSSN